MQGMRRVAAGEAALSPTSVRRVSDELAGQPDPQRATPELLEDLTARELEVMALVAGGLSGGSHQFCRRRREAPPMPCPDPS